MTETCLVFRLFGFGVGIHLLQSDDPENLPKKGEIDPKDNHISFQVIFRLPILHSCESCDDNTLDFK